MAQAVQSTIRNRLLATLSPEDFELLSPHLEAVELPFKQVLIVPYEPIRHVHFPDTGLSSFVALFEGGGSLEVGMIGRDGLIGMPILLGADTVAQECLMQIPGNGWRMEAEALRQAAARSPSLQTVLLRCVMAFLAQVSQTAACNGAHRLDERLARWLLMSHDRCEGDRLPLTQEFLSTMLGVRRAGVTVAAGALQRAGIINYISGDITVLNRSALEIASCECYGIVREQTKGLLA
ncbi:Crp/Fnr family transcriptional regulator (plasmid) [Azospirillum brasilense]|uniref:Crp/Fnr family transcriptional regulator n=1 Tax=Azospirillum brasilense TaxID=192 RepID=A0A4D8R7W4_AZOBR|nr:Crp/Fnr family transcriptional regulator [Azospirillum brasilense]QCO16816.1 Crp/Fnr family transcriptional regulator [Azospirillum brasilense]